MRWVVKACVTILALSVLWGCGMTPADKTQTKDASEPPAGKVDPPRNADFPLPQNSGVSSDAQAAAQFAKPEDAPAPADTAADAKAVAAAPKVETAPRQKTEEPKVVEHSNYNAKAPTLVNLSIGDLRKKVAQKYGKPKYEYVMEDESDSFLVYDYNDFSVGFTKEGRIQFIEVFSDQVDPGLNGLRLGHKVQDAIKALGNPDTNTEFVLSYKSDNAILKLDVDPKTQVIHSIKLFSSKD